MINIITMIKSSELIINPDGSIFHLHLKPENIADTILLVGDPDRVKMISSYFDTIECNIQNREFITATDGTKGVIFRLFQQVLVLTISISWSMNWMRL